MGAFAHSGWGRTLGEIIAFFLFAGSRPQRNPIVSSPTRRPQLGAPRTDSFPNMPAGSESCPGRPPSTGPGGRLPLQVHTGSALCRRLRAVGPQPGSGQGCSPAPKAASGSWLILLGTSRRASRTSDSVWATSGARCGQEEGYVYFLFSPLLFHESCPRS